MGDELTFYIYAIPEYLGEGQGVIGAGTKNERHMAQNQLLALYGG